MDYKSNSSCSSPGKQEKGTLERMDRSDRHPAFGAPVPVLPVRNNLRATHFAPTASRFHFRKGLSSRCSWKCTAIVFIILFVLLLSIASYMSGAYHFPIYFVFRYSNSLSIRFNSYDHYCTLFIFSTSTLRFCVDSHHSCFVLHLIHFTFNYSEG